MVAPLSTTIFTVTVMNSDSCYASDTITIYVDNELSKFIPTAFTPNGDGLNDVFRLCNVHYQKLVEFSVYNRWGQMVYHNTTDPMKGWDGTFNGQPQDMGVYQYLIRVAYPDGYVETYQGNVTLVR